MAPKITLLFALIATAIEFVSFVYSVPISGDLTDGLGLNTGSRRGGANPNGLLHGFRSLLDDPLCGVGLGCDGCAGPLSGLQPTLGRPINSLGLGADCQGHNCGGNDGDVPIGNGNDDGDLPIGNCNDDVDLPIGDGNDDGDCNCHGDAVPIYDSDDGHGCHDCGEDELGVDVDIGGGECE